jgi:ribosomal protein L31
VNRRFCILIVRSQRRRSTTDFTDATDEEAIDVSDQCHPCDPWLRILVWKRRSSRFLDGQNIGTQSKGDFEQEVTEATEAFLCGLRGLGLLKEKGSTTDFTEGTDKEAIDVFQQCHPCHPWLRILG